MTRKRAPFFQSRLLPRAAEKSHSIARTTARRRSFKAHSILWSNKGRLVANPLCTFGNTQRGASALLLRHSVRSCVISVATYGADVWWPEHFIITRGHILQECLGIFNGLRQQTLLNNALRAILPVYRTTPLVNMKQDAGIHHQYFLRLSDTDI